MNWGSLVSEVTALPTAPQPLTNLVKFFSRWEDGQDSIPKVLAAPIEAYNFHVECQTLEELQNIQVTHPIILKTALGEISPLGHNRAHPDVGSVRGHC